jgi:hypothetical protein
MKRILTLFFALLSASMSSMTWGAPCVEVSGVLTCDQVVVRDGNTAATNSVQIYPNVGATPGPTCTTGTNLKIIDTDNTGTTSWGVCGTTVTITGSDNVKRLVVKAATGQTAFLQEWQSSVGGVVARMSATGGLKMTSLDQGINIVSGSTYTLGNDVVLICDATAQNVTINLPAASGLDGRTYYVKKIDSTAHTCTIDANGSELIDGALTLVLATQWTAVTLITEGTTWYIF